MFRAQLNRSRRRSAPLRSEPSLVALGLLAALALPAAASACAHHEGRGDAPTAATDREGWETTGTVRRIEPERRSITIQHEEVPGYMPAMTMPFEVEDARLLEGLSVGDHVRFRFVRAEGGRHVLRAIHRM
jgi:Cu/Ag efflux protein CusF